MHGHQPSHGPQGNGHGHGHSHSGWSSDAQRQYDSRYAAYGTGSTASSSSSVPSFAAHTYPTDMYSLARQRSPEHAFDYRTNNSYSQSFSSTSPTSSYSQGFQHASPAHSPYDSHSPSNFFGYDPMSKLSSIPGRAISARNFTASYDNRAAPQYNANPTSPSPPRSSPVQQRLEPSPSPARQPRPSAYTAAEIEHRSRIRAEEAEQRNRKRAEDIQKRQEELCKRVEDSMAALKAERLQDHAVLVAERKRCRRELENVASQRTNVDNVGIEPDVNVDPFLALGCQIRAFWEHSRPKSAAMPRKSKEMIAAVQQGIDLQWPGQGLEVAAFGSTVTGLVSDTSDLDLVLLDPTRPFGVGTPNSLVSLEHRLVRHRNGFPDWYDVHQIAKALKRVSSLSRVVAISGANVPIVKMVFRGHLDADLNVNDRFGLQNSRMIAAYADLQPELVRPLIFFLKHWFKRRGLNDPSGKNGAMSFSSYTIALLAIQYLQVEGVLPNLQDPVLLKHLSVKPQYLWTRARTPRQRREGDIVKTIPSKGYNVTFSPRHHRDLRNTVEKQGIVEGLSNSRDIFDWRLGKLLVGFVRFYLDFPRNRQAVSVANGAPLTLDIDYTIDSVGGSQNGEDSVVSESLRSDASDATQDQDRATDDEDDDTDRDVDSVAADQGILTMHDFRQPADWLADELIVQDPFILDRNTSRNIKLKTIQSWHGELERALLILEGQIGDDTVSTTSKGTLSSSYSDDSRAVDDETPLIADLCVPTSILGTVSERGAQAVRAARFSVQDSLIDLVDARQTEARDAMIKKEEKQANKEKYRKKARRRYRGKNRRDKTDDDNDDKPGTTANDRYGSEPNKQQPPKVWPPADGSTSSRFDFALPSPGRKKQRRPSDNIETVTTRLQKQADIH